MALDGNPSQCRRNALRRRPDIVKRIPVIAIEIVFGDELVIAQDHQAFDILVSV
jgi:hypothetical protein